MTNSIHEGSTMKPDRRHLSEIEVDAIVAEAIGPNWRQWKRPYDWEDLHAVCRFGYEAAPISAAPPEPREARDAARYRYARRAYFLAGTRDGVLATAEGWDREIDRAMQTSAAPGGEAEECEREEGDKGGSHEAMAELN